MHLDRLAREIHDPTHLFVAETFGQEMEQPEFLVGEPVFLRELFFSVALGCRIGASMARNREMRQIGGVEGLALMGVADDLDEILLIGVFENVSRSAGA